MVLERTKFLSSILAVTLISKIFAWLALVKESLATCEGACWEHKCLSYTLFDSLSFWSRLVVNVYFLLLLDFQVVLKENLVLPLFRDEVSSIEHCCKPFLQLTWSFLYFEFCSTYYCMRIISCMFCHEYWNQKRWQSLVVQSKRRQIWNIVLQSRSRKW